MALSILIDGTDYVAALREGTLKIVMTPTGTPGRCDFELNSRVGYGIPRGMGVTLVIADSSTYFNGTLVGVEMVEVTPGLCIGRMTGRAPAVGWSAHTSSFSLSDQDAAATYMWLVEHMGTAPLSWWRLGEANGTSTVDHMAYRNGTYVNAPTLGESSGFFTDADTAVSFNGTDEYVDCGVAMLSGKPTFSIAAWFKTSSTAAIQTIYCERNATTGNALIRLYIDANGRPTFQYRDNAGTLNTNVPASGDWSDGGWHLVTVSKAGTDLAICVDGVSKKTATLTANDTLSGTIVARIGCDPRDGQFFPGVLDEVMIWDDYDLNSDEAMSLYASRNIKRYASLRSLVVYDGSTTQEEVDVVTYDAGLWPNGVMAVNSAHNGFEQRVFTIMELQVEWYMRDAIRYTASLGGSPLHLATSLLGMP